MKYTLLTSADNPKVMLTKTYQDDKLNPVSYNNGLKYDADIVTFNTIQELYADLVELECEPHSCIIRGQPIINPMINQQRLEAEVHGDKRTLIDRPLDWICIDFDKMLTHPPEIQQHEIPEFILYSVLPSEFHNSDYIFQFSGSAGLKHWTKGHYFFLLDTPADSTEMKRWAKVNGYCDPAMFKAIQPHYTASPIFNGGVKDPIKQRTFLKVKSERTVTINIPSAESITQISDYEQKQYQEVSGVQGNYNKWRMIIDQITAGGAHSNFMSAAGSYHFQYGVHADWDYFLAIYLQKLQSVRHHRASQKAVQAEFQQAIPSIKIGSSLNKPRNTDPYYVLEKLNKIQRR